MLYGNWFVASLVDSDTGARDFLRVDPDPELFVGPEKDLFMVIQGHFRKYGVLPKRETLSTLVPDVSMPKEVPEPPKYYYDLMLERHRHITIKKSLLEAEKKLNDKKPKDAEEALFKAIIELRQVAYRTQVVDYAQEGARILYDLKVAQSKGYADGIKTGWPSVDSMSNGFMGGDLISFVGRPAKGKTWMLLWLALQAWRQGKVPLFVSMEMNVSLITQRLAAMDTHTSIGEINMGNVQTATHDKMMTQLVSNKTKKPFWLVDGALSATTDDIKIHVMEKQPDIIFVDGAYMVRIDKWRGSRWEQITQVAEQLKRDVAAAVNIPVVASFQFNREAEKKAKSKHGAGFGVEDIAGADAIGQISSLVFGMIEQASVETEVKRRVEILKGRQGESGEFYVNWQFDKLPFMDFSEVTDQDYSKLGYM